GDSGRAGGGGGLHAGRDGRRAGSRGPSRRVASGPPAGPLPRGLPALLERFLRRRAGALPLPARTWERRGLGGPVRAGALRRGLLPPDAAADAAGERARDQHGPGGDGGLTHVAGGVGSPGATRVARLGAVVERSNAGGPMRVGVLTGGGDCPGLNAVIRA